jgi:hypothetical protein
MKKYQKGSGGVSFLGLLAIVFITLKLCNVIDWSWWWVTCPLWIGIAIVGVIGAITLFGGAVIFGGAGLMGLFKKKKKTRRW